MASANSVFGSATLVLQGPGGKVRFEVVGDRTTVGRTRDNDIVLQDPAVSSRHCELTSERGSLVVRDLDSSNGTYVNGRRVQAAPLFDGDALKIGQYQGRIAVRRLDGKALSAPGALAPMVLVTLLVLLIVGAGVGGFFYLKGLKDADRALFVEYETRAKALLTSEPCGEIEEAARKLGAIARELDEPQLGRRGRALTTAQKRHNTKVLEASRQREPLIAQALAATQSVVDTHKSGIEELRGFATKFNDVELASSVSVLETLYASRIQKAEEVASQVTKHAAQLTEFNALLQKRIDGDDRDAYDQLNGYRFRLEPARIAGECRKAFAESQQDGLLKLAGITL